MTKQKSFNQIRGYIVVDEYGGPHSSTLYGSPDGAKLAFIEEYNKGVDSSPFPEPIRPKKINNWSDADALGLCIAEVHWKYIEGWKVKELTD